MAADFKQEKRGSGQSSPYGSHGRPAAGGGRPGGVSAQDGLEVTSPYNFVPLSEKVFFPEWADQVSHDIPLRDGISGELVCELVTTTPTFVRNGGYWKDHAALMNDRTAWSFFCVEHEGKKQFIIPGTTLKGMLRNVVEIASFGKFCRVDNHRYSVRDLNNKDKSLYMNWMTRTVADRVYETTVKAGWLKAGDGENGKWEILPCKMSR